MSHDEVTATSPATASELPIRGPSTRVCERIVAVRSAVSAAIGSVLAIVPHVLHHVGILAADELRDGLAAAGFQDVAVRTSYRNHVMRFRARRP